MILIETTLFVRPMKIRHPFSPRGKQFRFSGTRLKSSLQIFYV